VCHTRCLGVPHPLEMFFQNVAHMLRYRDAKFASLKYNGRLILPWDPRSKDGVTFPRQWSSTTSMAFESRNQDDG